MKVNETEALLSEVIQETAQKILFLNDQIRDIEEERNFLLKRHDMIKNLLQEAKKPSFGEDKVPY